MNFEVFDMLGKEIVENDTVVGSFSSGSRACLRIGIVKEKKITIPSQYNTNYYLKIRWVAGRGRPGNPTLISVEPNSRSQLLKVDVDEINKYS